MKYLSLVFIFLFGCVTIQCPKCPDCPTPRGEVYPWVVPPDTIIWKPLSFDPPPFDWRQNLGDTSIRKDSIFLLQGSARPQWSGPQIDTIKGIILDILPFKCSCGGVCTRYGNMVIDTYPAIYEYICTKCGQVWDYSPGQDIEDRWIKCFKKDLEWLKR